MPFEFINKGGKEAEVRIFGAIGNFKLFEDDVSPVDFQKQLDALGDVELLNVLINSPGGGIYAGITIGNMLKNHKALVKTRVYGMCASIATVVLQAGDERTIVNNGSMFLHNPMGGIRGNAVEMRKYADELDKAKEVIIASFDRTKMTASKLSKLMDEETTLTAKEALSLGLVDEIETSKVKATVKSNIITFDNMSFDTNILGKFDSKKIEQWDGDKPTPDNSNEWANEMENRYMLMNKIDCDIISLEI